MTAVLGAESCGLPGNGQVIPRTSPSTKMGNRTAVMGRDIKDILALRLARNEGGLATSERMTTTPLGSGIRVAQEVPAMGITSIARDAARGTCLPS
jgi:hypothetical protein